MSQQTNVRMWVVTLILAVAVASMANLSFIALTSETRQVSAPSSEAERTLLVSGSGKVSVAPDEAQVALGVETEASTAKEAAASNAQSMDRVINALKAAGVAESNIKTITYAVTPVYSYPRDGKPELVGYRVTNTVLVKTQNLERVGDIIDAAVTAGANTVGGIAFTLSDSKQKELRTAAIEMAVADASEKAQKLASEFNVQILGVQTVTVSEGGMPTPYIPRPAPAVAEAKTPVYPGESELTVSVQVSYLIAS